VKPRGHALLFLADASGGRHEAQAHRELSERVATGARQAEHDPALLLIDVRTPEEFARGHAPGGVSIANEPVAGRLVEVPKHKDVVLYFGAGRCAVLVGGERVAAAGEAEALRGLHLPSA